MIRIKADFWLQCRIAWAAKTLPFLVLVIDREMKVLSEAEAWDEDHRIAALIRDRHPEWVRDYWDCDKFAKAFQYHSIDTGINSVALASRRRHVFNLRVVHRADRSLDFWFPEPQTGQRRNPRAWAVWF